MQKQWSRTINENLWITWTHYTHT